WAYVPLLTNERPAAEYGRRTRLSQARGAVHPAHRRLSRASPACRIMSRRGVPTAFCVPERTLNDAIFFPVRHLPGGRGPVAAQGAWREQRGPEQGSPALP